MPFVIDVSSATFLPPTRGGDEVKRRIGPQSHLEGEERGEGGGGEQKGVAG